MNLSLQFSRIQSLIAAPLAIAAIFAALNCQGHEYSFRWTIASLFILLLLTVGQLLSHYGRNKSLTENAAWISYSLFVLWSLASLLWSPVPSDSLLFWLPQLSGVFAIYLGYQADDTFWRWFKLMLLPIALTAAGYTLYQAQILNIDRPSGFLLNWNSNAAFLALLILPFCSQYLTLDSPLKKHTLGLCLTVCTLAMAATQSRGGLLVLAIGLAPLAWQRVKRQPWQLAGLIVYLALGYLLAEWLLSHGTLMHRLSQNLNTENLQQAPLQTLGSGRHALWTAAWHMYLDKPWLGWGIGMFHWLYPQYRDPLLLERGQLAHNDYLDTLLGLGPVGLVLLLWFVANAGRLLRYAWRSNDSELLALAGASMAILVHSFFSFNLFQTVLVIVLGFYIGHLGRAALTPVVASQPERLFNKKLYFAATGTLGVVFSAWLFTLFMGFYYCEQSVKASDPINKIDYLGKAQQWLPYMASYDAILTDTLMALLRQQKPDDMRPEEQQALLDFTAAKIEDLLKKNPLDAANYRKKGDLLLISAGMQENQETIMALYRQTLALDPYDLYTRYRLAAMLENREQEVEAYRLLFGAFDKAYFTNPKAGLQLLYKIKNILATTHRSKAQDQALTKQIDHLETRARRYQADNFILRDIGIPLN